MVEIIISAKLRTYKKKMADGQREREILLSTNKQLVQTKNEHLENKLTDSTVSSWVSVFDVEPGF